jgi:hypothetical protein
MLLKRRGKQYKDLKLYSTENLSKIGEEGYKMQPKKVFVLQSRLMSRLKGRTSDSLNHSARDTQRQTLTKAVLRGFLAKRRLALCCQGKRAL